MKEFIKSSGFIISFMISTIIMNMTFGKKMTQNFLILVLLSMIILNADEFKSLLERVTTTDE